MATNTVTVGPEHMAYHDENRKIRILCDKPQRAVTAGQAVVLYDGDTVVGGGVIC